MVAGVKDLSGNDCPEVLERKPDQRSVLPELFTGGEDVAAGCAASHVPLSRDIREGDKVRSVVGHDLDRLGFSGGGS